MAADRPPASSRKLLEHALLLIARQHGGNADTARAAREQFAQWRSHSPAHEAAAQAALRGWAATQAGELRDSLPLPPTQPQREARSRRNVLSVMGITSLAAAMGAASRWYWLQPLEQLALDTGHGQLLARSLLDGSQIDLGPRTQAQVALYRDRREVRLSRGEMRFEVQPDPARPFDVLTEWGRVRVVGTAFTVTVREQRMAVAVAHGRVAVWSGTGSGSGDARPPDLYLDAGQSVQADAAGLGETGRVVPGDVGAWRQGWLVFDQAPLPDVLARWNDYLAQPLRLGAEPALRALRLTGSFPVRDPASFMASLPKVLPVSVERTAQGTAVIHLRR